MLELQLMINLIVNIYNSLPPVATKIGNEKREKLKARLRPY